MNSFVPSPAIIDFSPLCPPALPRARKRIVPNGKAKSSLTTINDRAVSVTSYFDTRQATASPLKFMNRHSIHLFRRSRLVYLFLLTLADALRFNRRFAFNRHDCYRLFLNLTDRGNYSFRVFQDFDSSS